MISKPFGILTGKEGERMDFWEILYEKILPVCVTMALILGIAVLIKLLIAA